MKELSSLIYFAFRCVCVYKIYPMSTVLLKRIDKIEGNNRITTTNNNSDITVNDDNMVYNMWIKTERSCYWTLLFHTVQ